MYVEVPPLTDSKNFFPMESSYVSKLDTFVSVTVGIPDDCHSSDWWGVSVLVALDAGATDEDPVAKQMRFYWIFDSLEPEDDPSLSLASGSTANNDLYLFTMVVSGDFIYIRHHLRGDQKWKQQLFSKHRKPELKENSLVRFKVQVGGCKIRKCVWRVLREEDFGKDLQKVNSSSQSYTTRSRGLSKPTVGEFQGQDVTSSDKRNIERSNDNNLMVSKDKSLNFSELGIYV